MKTLVSAILGMSFLASEALAADVRCTKISGKIRAAATTEGCDSPVGICTKGKIILKSKRGKKFLKGDTFFTALGLIPGAGFDPNEFPPTTSAYHGIFTVMTKHGTIVMRDQGMLGSAEGVYTELDQIVDGDGAFDGATGDLFIRGTSNEDLSVITGIVNGEICRPKPMS